MAGYGPVDRVAVVTMDHITERYDAFLRSNPRLPVERFSGVDGRVLDRWDLVDQGVVTGGNPYARGQLGALCSHVALWRRAASEGRSVHVAEDDAVFREDFVERASAMLASLGEWDVVLWGWNFDWPLRVDLGGGLGPAVVACDQDAMREGLGTFPADDAAPVPLRLLSAAGSLAYSVSAEGARRLLDACPPVAGKPAPHPGNPAVEWTNRSQDVEMSRHYPSLRAYVSVPCLAVSPNVKEESTVWKAVI